MLKAADLQWPQSHPIMSPEQPKNRPITVHSLLWVTVLTGLWVMWSLGVTPSYKGLWGHEGLWIRAPPLGHREP